MWRYEVSHMFGGRSFGDNAKICIGGPVPDRHRQEALNLQMVLMAGDCPLCKRQCRRGPGLLPPCRHNPPPLVFPKEAFAAALIPDLLPCSLQARSSERCQTGQLLPMFCVEQALGVTRAGSGPEGGCAEEGATGNTIQAERGGRGSLAGIESTVL